MNRPSAPQSEISTGAARVAVGVARRLGLGRIEPIVLHESEHVSVRLFPFDIVARVVGTQEGEAAVRLERELAVARHLVEKSAPVVPPSTELAAGPHFHDGYGLTLWRFIDHVAADADNSAHVASAAQALRRVHQALADFPGELPSFRIKIGKCRALLETASALPALPAADRRFLLTAYDRILAAVDALPIELAPLHGDAHLANVFITTGAALWNDFDDACMGPRAWDIGWLPDAGLRAFAPVDRALLSVFSDLRSLCVCVWCWDKYSTPEKREAADYHLGYLRDRFC